MRPKFILTLLVIAELLVVALLCSPGTWKSKRRLSAEGAWLQSRTPETERAFHSERDRERRTQYIVCTLAVLGAVSIIVYGASQHRRTA
jgi:hypothetical protein